MSKRVSLRSGRLEAPDSSRCCDNHPAWIVGGLRPLGSSTRSVSALTFTSSPPAPPPATRRYPGPFGYCSSPCHILPLNCNVCVRPERERDASACIRRHQAVGLPLWMCASSARDVCRCEDDCSLSCFMKKTRLIVGWIAWRLLISAKPYQ